MNNPFNDDQMLGVVSQTLADVLGCPIDEVQPAFSVAGDLGADSLDLVELRYLLEKKLGVSLPQTSVLEVLTARVGDESLVLRDGRLTELAALALRGSPFRYEAEKAGPGMQPHEVFSATTVRHWANLCHGLFDHLPGACPECGDGAALASPVGKAVCAGCGAALKPATGDAVLARGVELLTGSSVLSPR